VSNLFCKVNLCQAKRLGIDVNEHAKTICQLGRELLWGSEANGSSPYNVTLRTGCPEGGKPVGIFHTHPGGVAEPSAQDLAEMRRAGLEHLCISDDNVTKCYRVK